MNRTYRIVSVERVGEFVTRDMANDRIIAMPRWKIKVLLFPHDAFNPAAWDMPGQDELDALQRMHKRLRANGLRPEEDVDGPS